MSPSLLVVVTLSVVLLAGGTVLWQEHDLGLANIQHEQLARHRNVLMGRAPNPWRYRVLAEWVAEGFIDGAQMVGASRPVVVGYLALRLLQNGLLFATAFAYYRRLGMDARRALLGIMIFASACTYANFNSDLSVNTYFDVLFYLLAALSVLSAGPWWLLLAIGALASLNRETSGLIPLLPLAKWVAHPRAAVRQWRRLTWLPIAGLAIWLAIFLGLRVWIGSPPQSWQAEWGYTPGLPTIAMNLSSHLTLMYLVVTFSILPVLVLWEFGSLPDFLRGLFWLMVPGWLALHIAMVPANETRIFLVPIVLVLIPGALYRRGLKPVTQPASIASTDD